MKYHRLWEIVSHPVYAEGLLWLTSHFSEEDALEIVRFTHSRRQKVETLRMIRKNGLAYTEEGYPKDVDVVLSDKTIPWHLKTEVMEVEGSLRQSSSTNVRAPRGSIRDTFIYTMRCERTGLVKIGRSKNPKVRESTLQSEKPDLVMLKAWPGSQADEQFLHNRFKERRRRGEWFELVASDLQQIEAYMIGRNSK